MAITAETPMQIDQNELERLSKAATQGVWEHALEGDIQSGEHLLMIIAGENYAQWRDAPDGGQAEFKANGDFVCALVNAYRTGHLVPVQQQSGYVVEAVAELQLAAFLAGRGSVTGMKHGTRTAKPAPTMDQFRQMARAALGERP